MPIHRLTIFAVFATAAFMLAPVQAKTSHSQARPVAAKHAHKHTAIHHHVVHAKHGKVARTKHHVASSHSSIVHASFIDTDVAIATTNASMMTSLSPDFGQLQAAPLAMTAHQLMAPNMVSQQQTSAFGQLSMLSQSTRTHSMVPAKVLALSTGNVVDEHNAAIADFAAAPSDQYAAAADADGTRDITDLRKALIAMAMKMRDIQYVRGGHDPTTGFDCSGFVRYVFAHAVGMQLPTNSAAQFLAGLKVSRAEMQPGDLVFFHTHGGRRVTHVGIYISNGRFIHSPTTGKSVEISSLNDAYWARRFVGAKRPEALALIANKG